MTWIDRRKGAVKLHPSLMWLLSLVASLATMPAASQVTGERAVAVEVAAETPTPAPGSAVTLALKMTPAPGWHGYWKNPGDAGVEGKIDWTLPQGVRAGSIKYPVPETLIIGGLMNYVYEKPYVQLVNLALDPSLTPGTPLAVRGTYNFLACTKDVCVPQTAKFALDLSVGPRGSVSQRQPSFETARRMLPRPLGSTARFEIEGDRFRLAIPLPVEIELSDPYFFPVTDGAVDYAAPQSISRAGDVVIVETAIGVTPEQAKEIEGLIRTQLGEGLSFTAVRGSVPPAGNPIGGATESDWGSVAAAFAAALLGGLLLNVMPCVFPILSLKALSFARAGDTGTAARAEGLAYTAGAVLVCAGLGATLLGLRAAGVSAGWAFQLQDPRVVSVLLLLVSAIAFNLAGLFELPTVNAGGRLAARGGMSGAFWTGALAAFVATPCTGPFMGAALGAALVLPTPAAMAIFVGLGLGLALPFLLLGLVPALRKRLPKPGPWMSSLRRILSIPMFATALGLAWVLGRQAGVDAMTVGLGLVVLLALALWWIGTVADGRRRLILVPVAIISALAIWQIPIAAQQSTSSASGLLSAEPFSEERLEQLRGEQKPVFVYFTADWCITCKVNERTALKSDAVAKAFADKRVQVLVGDWTNGDPKIGRFIEKYGRSGVPLYLYYAPGEQAEVLPQLLTPSMLTKLGN